ncbi:MAG: type II toxin-antitoxin system VapC family toxin [Rhodoferax sp.]
MLYVDTSVLVALCTHEPKTPDVFNWYATCTGELASAAWCVTEFASALGLKQRTGQLTQAQAQNAWLQFERVCTNDLELLSIETVTFHKAAALTMEAATGLRAGDALHLACAMNAKAVAIVTLDIVMAKNAKRLKLKPVTI